MSNPASLPPGFRFHPTDEELIVHYLINRVSSSPCPVPVVAEVDIYKHDPWDLPAKATYGDREWYFFSPRDRKYPNGRRPNRAAASGYWKATGTDKAIHTSSGKNHSIGVKKALVFYKGRPPRGLKTNWIMHEYRLAEAARSSCSRPLKSSHSSMRLDDWVLCRIYKKNSHLQPVPPLENFERQRSLRLQESSSVSDTLEDDSTLSRLFDTLTRPENTSFMAQPRLTRFSTGSSSRINGDTNTAHRQQTQTEPFVPATENSMKRLMECYLDSGRHFSGQFDGSLLEQHFFNQQLLLNSHLGLR
ncbi:unnamed protein product [Musa acuminata subsp. malaccensis]|uniref:(wild Malaysian banana) hypothetical protein n=1 Tax=Musa acuminata subsp. malaccensis TaxID=214687 RepID=A0A804KVM5_MUSAM|nr:PREDICTED: NAC transcription factor 29 [Musa acuminata subsp. malaccensis]CAG1853371.1 unnamed protein product [Musa acuminata subsp. malaccensis]